jgi:hypothetical protein
MAKERRLHAVKSLGVKMQIKFVFAVDARFDAMVTDDIDQEQHCRRAWTTLLRQSVCLYPAPAATLAGKIQWLEREHSAQRLRR